MNKTKNGYKVVRVCNGKLISVFASLEKGDLRKVYYEGEINILSYKSGGWEYGMTYFKTKKDAMRFYNKLNEPLQLWKCEIMDEIEDLPPASDFYNLKDGAIKRGAQSWQAGTGMTKMLSLTKMICKKEKRLMEIRRESKNSDGTWFYTLNGMSSDQYYDGTYSQCYHAMKNHSEWIENEEAEEKRIQDYIEGAPAANREYEWEHRYDNPNSFGDGA